MLVDNLFYNDIGNALEQANPNGKHKYLYAQNFVLLSTGSPFESLIPKVGDFWGPRVLTIQVISRAYDWPEDYLNSEVVRFKNMFSNWQEFTVHFWIDRVLANQIDALNSDTDYNDRLDVMKGKLISLCAELADFGWEFKGDLITGVDASFFQPYIDEFYAKL